MGILKAVKTRPGFFAAILGYLLLTTGYVVFASLSHDDGITMSNDLVLVGDGTYIVKVDSVRVGSPADKAGILPGDFISAYNNNPLIYFGEGKHTKNEKLAYIKQIQSKFFEYDKPTTYTLYRFDQVVEVDVDYAYKGILNLDLAVYLRWLSSLILVMLAAFIYWQRPGLNVTKWFTIYAFSEASYWMVSVFSNEWPTQAIYVFHIIGPLLEFLTNAFFFHFCLYYPGRKSVPRKILAFVYIFGLLNVAFYVYAFTTLSIPTEIPYWTRKAVKGLVFASGLLVLTYRFFRPLDEQERYRLQWVLGGALVYSFTLLYFYWLSWQQINDLTYIGTEAQIVISMSLFVFTLTFLFTIVRYKLFDINTVIVRTITYLLITGSLLGVYFFVTEFVHDVLMMQSKTAQEYTGYVVIVVAILLVNPMREFVQRWIDRAFYRDNRSDFETLRLLSQDIMGTTRAADVTSLLTQKFTQVLHTSYTVYYVWDEKARGYIAQNGEHHPDARLDPGHRLPNFNGDSRLPELVKTEALSSLDEPTGVFIDENSLGALDITSIEKDALTSVASEFAIGLSHKNAYHGFLLFGNKVNGKPLFIREVEIVRTICHTAAIAIENAYLYETAQEKKRIETEVNLARSVQKALVPQELPQIENLEIAAYSQPAREIGGDFYDLFHSDLGHWEIALGDVSGKGVSAGLIAATTTGICLARDHSLTDAAKILNEINSALLRTHIHGHNVALAYMTFDPKTRQVSLANAGIPYPILIREGKARFIKIGGLPVCSLADYNYKGQKFYLNAGDTLILYSDGFIETVTHSGSMWGFEGFLEEVNKISTENADTLCEILVEKQMQLTRDPNDLDDDSSILVIRGV